MVAEYSVVVKTPDGNTAVVPFIGSRSCFYYFLMDFYLDTDESTPGGMPWLVYERSHTTPKAAPISATEWLNRTYQQIRTEVAA